MTQGYDAGAKPSIPITFMYWEYVLTAAFTDFYKHPTDVYGFLCTFLEPWISMILYYFEETPKAKNLRRFLIVASLIMIYIYTYIYICI